MSTITATTLKVRRILRILGNKDDIARIINSASAAATSVILATKSQALNYKTGDTIKIYDDDATEINTVGTDGDGNTGVIAGLTALTNTYDSNPKIQLLNLEHLTDTEIESFITDALKIYSKHRPLLKKYEYIGVGNEYEYPLPSDWIEGFSVLKRIEYPAGDQVPTFIDQNEYSLLDKVDETARIIDNATATDTEITLSTASEAGYFKNGELIYIYDNDANEVNWVTADGNTTTGVVTVKNAIANTYDATPLVKKLAHIKFLTTEPETSNYMVQEYTTKHVHDDSTDTIYDIDLDPFTHLCAGIAAQAIAAEFAKKQKSSLDADSIDFGTKSDQWQTVAEENIKIYTNHIGKDETLIQPSFFIGDLDSRFSWGRNYLFHGHRNR